LIRKNAPVCSSSTAMALLFARGRKGDVNTRGAYLHLAADVLLSRGGSTGVLIALTDWY
jgi:cobalt-zinc-cadmium efflux system protein